jgi:glycosyltransferase involved in cell wall biosynthesis
MSLQKKPTLNVVVPVYNEQDELEERIKTLVGYLTTNLDDFEWFVTVADNASTDATSKIAKKLTLAFPKSVKYERLELKGRGRAVKFVWKKYETDVSAYMDVDLSSDLKHFPALVRSLLRGYDIAIGTRNLASSRVYGRNLLRTITSKGYIMLIKLFFQVRFSDAQCGFKAVTRKIVTLLTPNVVDNAWFFDTELLILAEKLGFRIYEEPVTWIDNPGSTVRVYKTVMGDLDGLKRLFFTRPWLKIDARS